MLGALLRECYGGHASIINYIVFTAVKHSELCICTIRVGFKCKHKWKKCLWCVENCVL